MVSPDSVDPDRADLVNIKNLDAWLFDLKITVMALKKDLETAQQEITSKNITIKDLTERLTILEKSKTGDSGPLPDPSPKSLFFNQEPTESEI